MSPSSNRKRNLYCHRYDCTNTEPHIGHTTIIEPPLGPNGEAPPLGKSTGAPVHFEAHMFPGMEHTRKDAVSLPDGMHLESTPPSGPSRQDRVTALGYAVDLVNHNHYAMPCSATVEFAERFAKFLHDGTVKQDGGDAGK